MEKNYKFRVKYNTAISDCLRNEYEDRQNTYSHRVFKGFHDELFHRQ